MFSSILTILNRCITNTFIFSFSLLVLFGFLRILFVLYGVFMEQISFSSSDFLLTLLNGLKYDARSSAFLVSVYFPLSFILAISKNKHALILRRSLAQILLILCVIIGLSNIGFYFIFHSAFNAKLFLLKDESFTTILSMGFLEFHLAYYLVALILIGAIVYFSYLKILVIEERLMTKVSYFVAHKIGGGGETHS
ncbi:hypothetical protein [Helicobacter cetorum]|uniref:Sulfatase n=1 Tax=Helicobacter cetorum (strain ATCC BAA-429 / MIT 00-7128) TaxID=182217 RepID=I0EMY2_HELC0|nr:hypothetical protein [Helicobacter cetorum]AFI04301.1 sulfatase [Helicobacter cetorum MIT 00-7128]